MNRLQLPINRNGKIDIGDATTIQRIVADYYNTKTDKTPTANFVAGVILYTLYAR